MIDPELTDQLSQFEKIEFKGNVFRATPKSIIDPLATSSSGGRWIPRNDAPVLYTSCERDGALAETSFHLSQHTPLPSKPIALHEISVATENSIKLILADLKQLGINEEDYSSVNYSVTQMIGVAINFMGYDGLIVPSARWDCDNLIIYHNNLKLESDIKVVNSEEVDWKQWAKENGFLS